MQVLFLADDPQRLPALEMPNVAVVTPAFGRIVASFAVPQVFDETVRTLALRKGSSLYVLGELTKSEGMQVFTTLPPPGQEYEAVIVGKENRVIAQGTEAVAVGEQRNRVNLMGEGGRGRGEGGCQDLILQGL